MLSPLDTWAGILLIVVAGHAGHIFQWRRPWWLDINVQYKDPRNKQTGEQTGDFRIYSLARPKPVVIANASMGVGRGGAVGQGSAPKSVHVDYKLDCSSRRHQ